MHTATFFWGGATFLTSGSCTSLLTITIPNCLYHSQSTTYNHNILFLQIQQSHIILKTIGKASIVLHIIQPHLATIHKTSSLHSSQPLLAAKRTYFNLIKACKPVWLYFLTLQDKQLWLFHQRIEAYHFICSSDRERYDYIMVTYISNRTIWWK